jgi:prevent-host-death family protein
MKQVNIHEAKTRLSQLIAEVEAGGEEVVVARAGKPVVRIIKELKEPRIYRRLSEAPWRNWEYDEEQNKAGDADILAAFEESINKPFD